LTDDKLTGTPFVEDAAFAERRENLKGRMLSLYEVQDVKLELCEITRTGIDLPAEKLYPEVVAVPSGVVQIAELQKRGFAYLKIQ
jgi:intracellular sulfur oxidation DsrE/DsrF family protein